MKVHEMMSRDAKSCSPDANLATAAQIMWDEDCGAVPVTDDQGKVVGVVTDRDICIAAATRSRAEGEIPVREVMSKTVYTCKPTDDVRAVMHTMKTQQVRRLPVVDREGRLAGIASIHDLAVQACSKTEIQAEDVLDTFVAITAPSRRLALPA